MIEGAVAVSCTEYKNDRVRRVERTIIEETPLTIYVNGRELATIMCTPIAVQDLVMGFLVGEGIAGEPDDVALVKVCLDEGLVNVRLVQPEVELPERRVLTSGCGGGVTFEDLSRTHEPLLSSLRISPAQVMHLMDLMQRSARLSGLVWGLHTSALSDGESILAIAQDVGRHNTLDKIRGQCLREVIDSTGCLLLSTGRISSEMLSKAAKMRVEMVVSCSSPTSLSVALAQAWGMTLIGYLRGQRMDIYSHPERLRAAAADQTSAGLSQPGQAPDIGEAS